MDKIVFLTCCGNYNQAIKTFSMDGKGKIHKSSYNAGSLFYWKEYPVDSIWTLSDIIEKNSVHPNKLAVRGQIKEGMSDRISRKMHGEDAAFEAKARHYVMLDIDKFPCPSFIDPAKDLEAAVKWVLASLPKAFQNVSCYYKFSSSQNVFETKTTSMHIWFWCNREVSDAEWKRYFKSVDSPVDRALFSPVQPHFTGNPRFNGMADPLPKRSGILKGATDVLAVPTIPQEEKRPVTERSADLVIVSDEAKQKALDFLKPYYRDGLRNRLCGAISGTLYRGGWPSEDIADFVHDLAIANSDEEANERYKNAFNICEAIDDGKPVQGIPTLQDEFKIENLDSLLDLLGVGKPDVMKLIEGLHSKSTKEDICKVLAGLSTLSKAKQSFYIDEIKRATKRSKTAIGGLLEESVELDPLSQKTTAAVDQVLDCFLQGRYNKGRHFLRSSDKRFWRYNGTCWEFAPDDFVKQEVIENVRQLINQGNISGGLTSLVTQTITLLEGEAYRENDPLRSSDRDMPPVINCLNGELWFEEEIGYTLRPHRADSYLRNCLNVEYDPNAACPRFKAAVLDIFSNSANPEEMYRNFMELAGYICQPWRRKPLILMLYGSGANGKSSLMEIIENILGYENIMCDRIGDIDNNVFKIGALDGKLMLLDDDVDSNTCLPDGFLKKISEQKTMTGQHKHKPSFEFVCRALPVMLANNYPSTSDLSNGIMRRFFIVPFDRVFQSHEQKLCLFDEIWQKEASGILNEVISGFERFRKRGNFDPPQDCIEAQKKWLSRANTLTAYIDEECIKGEKHKISVGDFYKAFTGYCSDCGIRKVPARKGIEARLESLGYRITVLNGKNVIRGLTVKNLDDKSTPSHVKGLT